MADQPAPQALWRLVSYHFPSARFGSITASRPPGSHQGHPEGRALDIMLSAYKPDQKAMGDRLFRVLYTEAPKVGIEQVIWNKQVWTSQAPYLRRYTGTSDHTDHVHVTFLASHKKNTNLEVLDHRLASGGSEESILVGDLATLIGRWRVLVDKWTWIYEFSFGAKAAPRGSVRWTDPFNKETGVGTWTLGTDRLLISWAPASTSTEQWNLPFSRAGQTGRAFMQDGPFTLRATKVG